LPAFDLGGRRIEYTVLRGTSRRYTYFRFRPDLTLEVVVPRGGVRDIGATIGQKKAWILQTYEEMLHTKSILDDRRVMYEGRFLDIVREAVQDKEELVPDPATGKVLVRTDHPSRVTELVRRWFLKESSRYVMKRLADISSALPSNFKMADVREIRNWGYCTRTGRLSFSWQLIALPERLRDYVIFHEVTHLEEFNHGAAFKRKLAARCPDFRQREKELDYISPADLSYF